MFQSLPSRPALSIPVSGSASQRVVTLQKIRVTPGTDELLHQANTRKVSDRISKVRVS